MLQYILNTTAIWLISLIVFDLFIRRESYHGYNRAYLLSTFIMGILLPLWQWKDDSLLYNTRVQEPVERVINTKQSIVAAGSTVTLLSWEQWIGMLYIAGTAIALALLIADIAKLYIMTTKGKKIQQGNWTVIETGKEHAPFSLLNTLYVRSIHQYSSDEWNMIVEHERKHTTLLHFTDLLLMQLARIVFWFHPLVYVYNKRLLMVHEYQADVASAREAQVYGRFLIEQALLQHAPSITHSFNRSPIKNRIVMLNRRSTTVSKAKMIVFVPLAVVCALCFSKNSFSQKFERKGNIVTYKGNRFELTKEQVDTQVITDPITGEQIEKYIKTTPRPEKMNGKMIPIDVDKSPTFKSRDKELRTYMLKSMRNELSKLDDGMYKFDVSSIVIDASGKIVYFDYGGVTKNRTDDKQVTAKTISDQLPATATVTQAPGVKVTLNGNSPMGNGPFTVTRINNPNNNEPVDKKLQENISAKVYQVIDAAPPFTAATLNGKKVAGYYTDMTFWNSFKIKDHKIFIQYQGFDYLPL